MEATAALNHHWDSLSIQLIDEGQGIIANPTEMGMLLDAQATSQAAATWGQQTDPRLLLDFYQNGAYVTPVWELDVPIAGAYLQEIASTFAKPAVDAGVQFRNGQLIATPSQTGREVDIEETLHSLQRNAGRVVIEGRLELVMRPVEPIIISTEEFVAEANGRLNTDLTLQLFDPVSGEQIQWALTPAEWGQWLTPTQIDAETLEWTLKNEQVSSYLNTKVASLGDSRYLDAAAATNAIEAMVKAHINGEAYSGSSLRVFHSASQHIVQSGETFSSIGREYGIPYPWIQAANPGITNLSVGQAITIPSPDEQLPLPIVENKRIIVSISEQRLWAYENGAVIWDWTISTGIADSPTSPGIFQVQSHEENAYAGNWDLWMPNFMGIYRPVPTSDFMNGFHGFPTRNGSNLLWTNSLGTRVTYGCILVGNENMVQLYEWADEGVVVEVVQ